GVARPLRLAHRGDQAVVELEGGAGQAGAVDRQVGAVPVGHRLGPDQIAQRLGRRQYPVGVRECGRQRRGQLVVALDGDDPAGAVVRRQYQGRDAQRCTHRLTIESLPMAGRELTFDELRVVVHPDTASLASEAAEEVAAVVLAAVAERGEANAMFATGNSQLAFVEALVARTDISWESVRMFHMDEYVGVGADHPAGFRRWIRERLAERLPVREVHYIDGTATDPEAEAARYAALLANHPLDLCCLGIGENGHLAFNDPPVANFDDPVDVKVVELDHACRQQQVGEGHFPTLADVPPNAITVTVPG